MAHRSANAAWRIAGLSALLLAASHIACAADEPKGQAVAGLQFEDSIQNTPSGMTKITVPVAQIRQQLADSPNGDWTFNVTSPSGVRQITSHIEVVGDTFRATALDGSVDGNFSGEFRGGVLRWKNNVSAPFPLTLDYTASLSGGQLSGTVKAGAFGSSPLRGARAPGADVQICPLSFQPPKLADAVTSELTDRHILTQFRAVQPAIVLVASQPTKEAGTSDGQITIVRYYYFASKLSGCTPETCDLEVASYVATAPVSGGFIRNSQAVRSVDDLSQRLEQIAVSAVSFSCH